MDDAFVQLDRDALSKKLKLLERGCEQGELNQPSQHDQSFDPVENEIVSEIREHLNRAQIDARNKLSSYETRLSELKLLHETGAIRSETMMATGDFETLVRDWSNRIELDSREVSDAHADLQTFKREHAVRRPAKDAPPGMVTIGIIAIAALIEIFGNAVFLRVNDDLGYLGGIIGAIVVSAINITISYLFGRYLIPLKNLPSKRDSRIGWVAGAVWFLLTLAWNLLAAHYRDAKFIGMEDPEGAALSQLMSQPFVLDGIFSLGIFIIGIAVAVVVMLDAYKMDDPIPGYGDKTRQFRARCERYSEEVARANRELTGVRDDAITAAREVKDQLGMQFRERERIERAYSRFTTRFEQHEEHLEQTANHLLSVYRTANNAARSEPAPTHFSAQFVLERKQMDTIHFPPIREQDIVDAEAALNQCIDTLDAAFRHSISQFSSLKQLLAGLEDGPL